MFKIEHHIYEDNTKTQMMIHPYGLPIDLPVTVICGKKPGMTMMVTAQIHSGEYNGSAAVMRLAREIDPEQLSGNLILFHCVNVTGFWQRKRRFVPEDMSNLNANFPGHKKGTLGNKLAAWFVKEIFPQIDFIVDLHNGKDNDILESCLFYPRAEKVTDVSLAAAKCLNTKYLLASSNDKGLYGYAAFHMDIPGLLIERGCGCIQKEEWIEDHKESIRLLLNHFDMYKLDHEIEKKPQVIYPQSGYVTFGQRGVWNPAISLDQKVKKGDLLGRLTDFFGNEIKSYYAEQDGTIIYYIAGMCILEGDEGIAYGIDEADL